MQTIYYPKQTQLNLFSILLIFAMVAAIGLDRAQAQFKDDFSNADWQKRWEIHDDGADGAPSKWFVGQSGIPAGAFGTPTNILRGGGPSKKDEQAGCYALMLEPGSENWTNYTVSCDMFHMDNDYAGFFVRYVDELNYFRVWSKQEEGMQGGATSYGMEKVVNGEWTVFFGKGNGPGGDGIDGPAIPKGIGNIKQREWFKMTADVQGDTVTMLLKGKKVDSVKDPSLRPGGKLGKGKIALYNSTNPMAYDNFIVEGLAVEPEGKLATTWGQIKQKR